MCINVQISGAGQNSPSEPYKSKGEPKGTIGGGEEDSDSGDKMAYSTHLQGVGRPGTRLVALLIRNEENGVMGLVEMTHTSGHVHNANLPEQAGTRLLPSHVPLGWRACTGSAGAMAFPGRKYLARWSGAPLLVLHPA